MTLILRRGKYWLWSFYHWGISELDQNYAGDVVPLSHFVETWLQSPWENGISAELVSVSEFMISNVGWCTVIHCVYHCCLEECLFPFPLISHVALWLAVCTALHSNPRTWIKRPLDRASHCWQGSEHRAGEIINCCGSEPTRVWVFLLQQHGLVYPDWYIHLWRKGKRTCLQTRSLWIF